MSIAHDGEQALTQITRSPPQAALLDLGLPFMDGVTVAIRLLESFGRALRLIALTAHSDDATRRDVAGAGFDDLLVRPSSIYQILNAIRHGRGREMV